jgi:hypothetical protein
MNDPQGGQLTESEHKVNTLTKAQEWCSTVSQCDLPITVNQWKARNGRCAYKVYSASGSLIYSRG